MGDARVSAMDAEAMDRSEVFVNVQRETGCKDGANQNTRVFTLFVYSLMKSLTVHGMVRNSAFVQ